MCSSRRDKEDRSSKEKSRMEKSVKRSEKESLARKAPAKKRRTRELSSSSSSGSDVVTISSSDDFFLSSSSEDEAIAEVKIIDEEEEKQLRMLGEQREKHKERRKALQEAVRVHGPEDLLQKARAFTAANSAAERGLRRRRLSSRRRRLWLSCRELVERRSNAARRRGSPGVL